MGKKRKDTEKRTSLYAIVNAGMGLARDVKGKRKVWTGIMKET